MTLRISEATPLPQYSCLSVRLSVCRYVTWTPVCGELMENGVTLRISEATPPTSATLAAPTDLYSTVRPYETKSSLNTTILPLACKRYGTRIWFYYIKSHSTTFHLYRVGTYLLRFEQLYFVPKPVEGISSNYTVPC